jgi:hypothetical protein
MIKTTVRRNFLDFRERIERLDFYPPSKESALIEDLQDEIIMLRNRLNQNVRESDEIKLDVFKQVGQA